MVNKFKTGVCFHCGGDVGIHQFETNKCPYGGVEQPAHGMSKEIWMDSVFEDSGERRLHDAAPAMYEALKMLYGMVHIKDIDLTDYERGKIEGALQAAFPETINT